MALKDRLRKDTKKIFRKLIFTSPLFIYTASANKAQNVQDNPVANSKNITDKQKSIRYAEMAEDIYSALRTAKDEYTRLKQIAPQITELLFGSAVISALNAGIEGNKARLIVPELSEKKQNNLSFIIGYISAKANHAAQIAGKESVKKYLQPYIDNGSKLFMDKLMRGKLIDELKNKVQEAKRNSYPDNTMRICCPSLHR